MDAQTFDVTLHASGPAQSTVTFDVTERALGALVVLHQAPDWHTASGELLPSLAAFLNVHNIPVLQLDINEHPSNGGTPAIDIMVLERSSGAEPTLAEIQQRGHRPGWLDGVNANVAEALPRDSSPEGIERALFSVLSHPLVADVEPFMRHFDRLARGNTLLAAPEPSTAVRLDGELAVAAAQAVQARQTFLNPYLGAQQSLMTAYRKLAAAGTRSEAFASMLSVGIEANTTQEWQLGEMRLGLQDMADALGLRLAGLSSVESRGEHPAAAIWTMGTSAAQPISCGFRHPGDAILLLGLTDVELSGSVWELALHDQHLGGMPPHVRVDAELALATVLTRAIEDGMLSSSMAVADGGLAVALAKAAFRHGEGFAITLPGDDPTVDLFSESAGRALVSLAGPQVSEFEALCAEHGVPATRLGEVTGHPELEFVGSCTVDIAEAQAGRINRND